MLLEEFHHQRPESSEDRRDPPPVTLDLNDGLVMLKDPLIEPARIFSMILEHLFEVDDSLLRPDHDFRQFVLHHTGAP